jgi:hypothetical protein
VTDHVIGMSLDARSCHNSDVSIKRPAWLLGHLRVASPRTWGISRRLDHLGFRSFLLLRVCCSCMLHCIQPFFLPSRARLLSSFFTSHSFPELFFTESLTWQTTCSPSFICSVVLSGFLLLLSKHHPAFIISHQT